MKTASSRQPSSSLVAKVVSYGRLFMHPDTPWMVKGILLTAILYLLSPFDLVPDWILGLGQLDDLALVSLLVGVAIRLVNNRPLESSGSSGS
jgi:uncharacterized membrane protein YkvA (DUF1232 family)